MLASGVVWLLHEVLHLTAANVIGASALLALIAAVYAIQLVPNFTVRFLLYLLTHAIYRMRLSGKENIPQRGAALLVANHVSYVDISDWSLHTTFCPIHGDRGMVRPVCTHFLDVLRDSCSEWKSAQRH